MTTGERVALRLALRVEGAHWVAYIAELGDMKGAVRIGSILMRAVENNTERKEQFMALMRGAMGDAVTTMGGNVMGWNDPHPAPEHEKAWRA